MTRTTNSRIAGSTLLLYIAFGITSMVVSGRATRGEGAAARLASMATHATEVRAVVVLGLITAFEIPLALWLLVRGAAPPARSQ